MILYYENVVGKVYQIKYNIIILSRFKLVTKNTTREPA